MTLFSLMVMMPRWLLTSTTFTPNLWRIAPSPLTRLPSTYHSGMQRSTQRAFVTESDEPSSDVGLWCKLWNVSALTPLNYFCLSRGDQRVSFNLKSSKISLVALPGLFEYLCYGSSALIIIIIPSARGPALYVRIWRLQMSDSDVQCHHHKW